MFSMLNNGSGGAYEVEVDVGGVDEWGILRIPFLINLTSLHAVVNTIPSSSLKGGSMIGLYSKIDPLFPLKNLPLCVSQNTKVTA